MHATTSSTYHRVFRTLLLRSYCRSSKCNINIQWRNACDTFLCNSLRCESWILFLYSVAANNLHSHINASIYRHSDKTLQGLYKAFVSICKTFSEMFSNLIVLVCKQGESRPCAEKHDEAFDYHRWLVWKGSVDPGIYIIVQNWHQNFQDSLQWMHLYSYWFKTFLMQLDAMTCFELTRQLSLLCQWRTSVFLLYYVYRTNTFREWSFKIGRWMTRHCCVSWDSIPFLLRTRHFLFQARLLDS